MSFFSKVASNFVKERVSNTKTAFQLIIDDFKRYVFLLKWIFVAFSLGMLIYGIVSGTGNLVINCCLLGLLFAYSILDAILKRLENPNPSKKLRIVYAWLKIILNAAALVSSLYTLYSATINDIKPISIVLATLSMIMFIIKVLLEITVEVLQSKWALLKNAMIMDAKEHPNTSAKIFAPFIGDIEEVEVKESVKNRIKNKQEKL
jgi:hypothetical protein